MSGQGQVTKGQVWEMNAHSCVTHVFRSFFETESITLNNECISKTYEAKNIGQVILRSSKVSFHLEVNTFPEP